MSENEKKWLKHVYEQHKMCLSRAPSMDGQKSCEDVVFQDKAVLLPEGTPAPFSSANIECQAPLTGKRCLNRCESCGVISSATTKVGSSQASSLSG